jgi:hypothetical protein
MTAIIESTSCEETVVFEYKLSISKVGKNWHLENIDFLYHERENISPLTQFFDIFQQIFFVFIS